MGIETKTAFDLFGPDDPPRTTRQKLLVAALDLFHQQGFHAVGIDQVVARAGVTKTTFYNHFESKDEFAVEAIRLRDQWDSEAFRRDLDELAPPGDPRGTLLAAFDVLDRWFRHPDYEGCIFLNACHEFPSPHDPIRQAASEHYLRVEELLNELAGQAGAAEPGRLATELTMLIEAAFAMRQVSQRPDAALVARGIARAVLEHTEWSEEGGNGPQEA
jgi:AcrR family transcriptional regulator